MDWGAWWATVHGVTKSRIWLRYFTFTFHFHALENEMATHSSVLAWRIPGTRETGGLSLGSTRVGHDWSDLTAVAAAAASSWRRQWQPTPVLLPGKSHGPRSLVGYSPWDCEESDMTEILNFTFHFHALEKEMATYSSILACRIPGTEEPCGLLSMGSHRVRHDWRNSSSSSSSLDLVFIWVLAICLSCAWV